MHTTVHFLWLSWLDEPLNIAFKLPWIFQWASLQIDEDPGNIHGKLDKYAWLFYGTIFHCSRNPIRATLFSQPATTDHHLFSQASTRSINIKSDSPGGGMQENSMRTHIELSVLILCKPRCKRPKNTHFGHMAWKTFIVCPSLWYYFANIRTSSRTKWHVKSLWKFCASFRFTNSKIPMMSWFMIPGGTNLPQKRYTQMYHILVWKKVLKLFNQEFMAVT